MSGNSNSGRPRVPNELKRRRGTARLDRGVPSLTNVLQLPAAESMPTPPANLGVEGKKLWRLAWGKGVAWLAPVSDVTALERACQLSDAVALAWSKYRESGDASDGRLYVTISHELGSALGLLGFDPSARSRLGVAEVTAVSKLEKLKRAQDEV